jgi:hypothetical protein
LSCFKERDTFLIMMELRCCGYRALRRALLYSPYAISGFRGESLLLSQLVGFATSRGMVENSRSNATQFFYSYIPSKGSLIGGAGPFSSALVMYLQAADD